MAGVNDASALQRAFTSSGEAQTSSAMPARNAAPSAVVSWMAARRTGTPSTSAWNWHSRSITDAPPSTRISAEAARVRDRVDDVGGLERHRLDDRAGEMSARGAAGDADDRARAYGSHHGEPSPVNAGTT